MEGNQEQQENWVFVWTKRDQYTQRQEVKWKHFTSELDMIEFASGRIYPSPFHYGYKAYCVIRNGVPMERGYADPHKRKLELMAEIKKKEEVGVEVKV